MSVESLGDGRGAPRGFVARIAGEAISPTITILGLSAGLYRAIRRTD